MRDVIGTETSFKDHFSGHAGQYARYRPSYPRALFDYLSGLCDRHDRAWDCATGNGQAAIELARHFKSVMATDASSRQIESAMAHPRVEYTVATAEDAGVESGTVDLITVGQALHWFDFGRFFSEARRAAVENGVLAAWCYGLCEISSDIDSIVDELYADLLDEFWPAERVYVEQAYRNIAMPGSPIDVPDFHMQLDWRVDDMLGYLRTWSACQRYLTTCGDDPVSVIEPALRAVWGNGVRNVRWPLRVRVCRL